jgi:biopolymer transport protein ExbD
MRKLAESTREEAQFRSRLYVATFTLGATILAAAVFLLFVRAFIARQAAATVRLPAPKVAQTDASSELALSLRAGGGVYFEERLLDYDGLRALLRENSGKRIVLTADKNATFTTAKALLRKLAGMGAANVTFSVKDANPSAR